MLTVMFTIGGAENAGVENEGMECALDETYEASPATRSELSESPATAAAATDDCCEVCLVAPREVSHSYRVDTLASARVAHCALLIFIPVVQFVVRYVHGDARFFLMTLCTRDVIAKILCRFCTAV